MNRLQALHDCNYIWNLISFIKKQNRNIQKQDRRPVTEDKRLQIEALHHLIYETASFRNDILKSSIFKS